LKDGAIKVFHDKLKLKQYMTTKPILQKIFHTDNDSIQNYERTGSTKPQKKKRQEIESNIDLATHKQTLKV
jgi:hypothetical protein